MVEHFLDGSIKINDNSLLWTIVDLKTFVLQLPFPQALSIDIRGLNNAKEFQASSLSLWDAPIVGLSYIRQFHNLFQYLLQYG